jgi:2,3-bisphosphoglycerate-dependent phosphoglycerate mutase
MHNPTRLLIARHGNTFAPGDVVTRVGKHTDLPLVASGEEQARALGRYLLAERLIPDVAYSSTLQRTIRMAELVREIMGTSFPIQPLSLFDEIDYGVDENQPETKVIDRIGVDALHRWDTEAIVPPGWHVDVAAIIQGWQDFAAMLLQAHPGKTALVVTSNGIARFAPYLLGDIATFTLSHTLKLATGAVCLLEHHAGNTKWECRLWNHRPLHNS